MAGGEPSQATVKRLFTYSGDRCAFDGCTSPLFDATGACIGVICHIKAQSSGGPRYDIRQTEEERHGYDNLVLMCANHARVIDYQANTARYPTGLLTQWKQAHETAVKAVLGANPSLRQVVSASSSDAVVAALLGGTTGVSTQDAAVLSSIFHNGQLAAALQSGFASEQTPLTLRSSTQKQPD